MEITTDTGSYHESAVDILDEHDEPGTLEITASPAEFGDQLSLTLFAEGEYRAVGITIDNAEALAAALAAAVAYHRAHG